MDRAGGLRLSDADSGEQRLLLRKPFVMTRCENPPDATVLLQRFGLALSFDGHINLRLGKYAHDFTVLDPTCPCPTCDLGSERGLSRSYLHQLAGRETVGAHAITLHNITYQVRAAF